MEPPTLQRNPNVSLIGSNAFEIDLATWLMLVFRDRWKILKLTLLVVIWSVVYALAATPIYESKARVILPMKTGSASNEIINQLGSLTGMMAGAGSVVSGDFYVGLIKSRRMAEHILDKYRLMDLLGIELTDKNLEIALIEFSKDIDVVVTDDGFMTISYSFCDASVAHDVVYEVILETNQLINKLNIVKAREQREFLEERIAEVYRDFDSLEGKIKEYYRDNDIFEFESQAENTVNTLSQLLMKKKELQIFLDVQVQSMGKEHPEFKAKSLELKEIERQYDLILNSVRFGEDTRMKPLLPLTQIPRLEFFRKKVFRELEAQSELLKMLKKQYEMAKIEEKKESMYLRILDPPSEPVMRKWPKRQFIVAIAFFLGAFFSICFYTVLDVCRSNLGSLRCKFESKDVDDEVPAQSLPS